MNFLCQIYTFILQPDYHQQCAAALPQLACCALRPTGALTRLWCWQVGVYVGCCGSETHTQWLADIKNITGYEQTGCTLSMFANRLSFFFDFKGPSKSVDTGKQLSCQ